MAGLDNAKKAIGELISRANVNYRREIAGKEPLQTSLNRVFIGPPGTGKTTVAKLYGQILADIGLLSTNEVVYKTPDDFIGQCQALEEGLIGFESIIDQFWGYQRMAANLRRRGKDPRQIVPFNFVFKGPPGTGKTHTARIVGQIFYDMGFLSTNEVIECSASHLVGQYLGHTAPKVVDLLERALGKVLFIDEACRLIGRDEGGRRGFEVEAVGELVIVLAGYERDIDALMRVNPGLRGRFPTEVIFPPMSVSRMREHPLNLLRKDEVEVRDGGDVAAQAGESRRTLSLLEKLSRSPGWSNGRDIRTLANTITGSVSKSAALDDGEDGDDALFTILTAEMDRFLEEMLLQRVPAGRSVDGETVMAFG